VGDARREFEAVLAACRAPGDGPDAPLRLHFRSAPLAQVCLEILRQYDK
jgi:hypothetical protein